MYKIRGNLFCKILAVLVFTVSALAFVASTLAAVWIYDIGAYGGKREEVIGNAFRSVGHKYLWQAGNNYLHGDGYVSFEDTDFRFEIYDEAGECVFSNYDGQNVVWVGVTYNHIEERQLVEQAAPAPEPTITPAPTSTPSPTAATQKVETPQPTVTPSETVPLYTDVYVNREYQIKGYILEEDNYPEDEFSLITALFNVCYQYRYELIWLAVGSLLLALAALVFLFFAAGRKTGHCEVCLNFIGRIPYDLFACLAVCAFGGAMAVGIALYSAYNRIELVNIVLGTVFMTLAGEVALLFLINTAARFKAGGIIKSCIIDKILAWGFRPVKKAALWAWEQIKALPLVRKSLAIYAAVLLVEMFFICVTDDVFESELILWFVESLVIGLMLVYVLICMKKLRAGAKELAQGNEEYRIDTKNMKGELLNHAQDLNSIGDGITRAVNERMKSERFKTELITNVSHDIKTPLTSIINYVDLLEKEEPENENMREYIEVLSRQSAKLKKLIEDLIEASKASTGNLAVNLESCELGVLLEQMAGEYEEKLRDKGLELVLTKPENDITIQADGRHMWRIFDNLMNNIFKYGQSGTRVYLSLEQRENKAVVTFRNISNQRLNVSGEELMERFVRGDSSRNTEGSGLGLSIARSLMQLQKGEMKITVDGDLFKVELIFNENSRS